MAKLIAILAALIAFTAIESIHCEHVEQHVARLKRDLSAEFRSAHARPQMFDTQQQPIDQVPDEDLIQQQTNPSGSVVEAAATNEYDTKNSGVDTHVIKDASNKTKAAVRDVTVSNCGTGPNTMKNLNRIVNGTRSGPGMFPWQVYLRISTNQGEMLCGGSILNENWVLTAAHCISSEQDGHYTATAIEVVAGALDRFNQEASKQKAYADCAFKHPNWRGIQANFANDIALIRLPRMSGFRLNGNTVNGICIPPKTNPRFFYSGPAVVSGWGLTTNRGSTSRTLQYTKVSLLTHA